MCDPGLKYFTPLNLDSNKTRSLNNSLFRIAYNTLNFGRTMNRVNYKCRHFVLLASLVFVNLCDACNTNGPFCIIQQWSPWSTCNATCGAGVIRREKYICCNLHLYNDLNGCLHGCNMTNDWWQKHSVQTKTCGYCTQHGTFNSTLQQCVCKRMFGGPCCNRKLKTELSSIVLHGRLTKDFFSNEKRI